MKIGDVVLESKLRGYGVEWSITGMTKKGGFKCIRFIKRSDLRASRRLAKVLGENELYTEKYCRSTYKSETNKNELIKLKRTFKMSEIEKSEDLKNSYLSLAARGIMEVIS